MGVVDLGGGKYRLDYYDEHGQRPRTVITAPSKTDAVRMLAEIKLDVARRKKGLAPESPNPQGLNIGDVVEKYLAGPARRLASYTKVRAQTRMIDATISAVRVDMLTGVEVERWLSRLDVAGYAPRSVNHARTMLRTVLTWAKDHGVVAVGAAAVSATKPRKVPQKALTTLSLDEVRRLLAAEQDLHKRAIYATAIFTAMRRGEIWALTREAVDVAAWTITVRASNKRKSAKTGKVRVIPVHPELRPLLAAVLLSHKSALVFPSPATGEMRSEDAKTARDIALVLARIGITRPITFRDLRDTCATLLLQAGVSLAIVQRVLGHSSPVLTANTYGHLVVDDLRAGLDRISTARDHQMTNPQTHKTQAAPKSTDGVA
jgi:integrase